MEKSYLMLSLDDERAKDLADVMGNKTCKKILSLLAEREMSEGDIAKELHVPINTIEYNLNKLIKSNLVEKSKYFFWSVKGKKIPTYKLSNKYIIIAPKSRLAMKIFLPVVAVIGLVAAGIKYITPAPVAPVYDNAPQLMLKASESAGQATTLSPQISSSILGSVLSTPWEVFLTGSLIAIGAYFIVKRIFERRS